jgi:PII-like signaling protein
MNMIEVTMVRIYLSEKGSHLDNLMKRLHDWEKLRGVSVFRGISGYGDNGKLHTASLTDLSLDLPLVVEFFDEPEKIERTLEHLHDTIKAHHMVKWSAWVNEIEEQ